MIFALREQGPAVQSQASDYEHYYDHADFRIPSTVEASLGRLVNWANQFRKTAKWLDIGYGEGALLSIAQAHGWQCHGIEASPSAIEYGRSRGWKVGLADQNDEDFGSAEFDVVSMLEVLEHLPAPRRMLARAAGHVRPGGLLYLTTPNARGLNRRLLGLDWSIFGPPDHLTVWTATGIRRALGEVGDFNIAIRAEGFNPAELLQRLRRRRRDVPVNRTAAARALSASLNSHPLLRAFKRTVNAALTALLIGDTLKVAAIRRR